MESETIISGIRRLLHIKSKASDHGEEKLTKPVEFFSADQMERHAITLALSHKLAIKPSPQILLSRLSESEAILLETCSILTGKEIANDSFSPVREQLLDNFYLIQEQIYNIRRHLPKGYGNTLPQLAGTLSGYPRIYDIALQIIEHGDGRWDLERLNLFISAYQTISPLTLGELWATPITLGVALIETLASTSKRIVADRNSRELADFWADRLIEVDASLPKELIITIADMARSQPTMNSAFVAELSRRLRGAALPFPLTWIEQQLAEEGLTIEHLVEAENNYQAAIQVTVSNCIDSLRRFYGVNWRDFVENLSVVNKILQNDPTDTYAKMDFATRDRYRHVVERLARRSHLGEEKVAEIAIQLAQSKANSALKMDANHENFRESHIGFYLVSEGLSQLLKTLGIPLSFWERVGHFLHLKVLQCYFSSILILTAIVVYVFVSKASQSGISFAWLFLIGVVAATAGSQLAVALVNLAATLLQKPRPLPRMDFGHGIPSAYRSLVVVPAMLGSVSEVETLAEALEVRFLGNRDDHLHFMLLSDFPDADKEHMPEDPSLITLAKERITALNQQYSSKDSDIFFLCHRSRSWNESEQVWMGRERKRGKLADLNNLLRGKDIQKNFSVIVGRIDILLDTKYVITLDSDTDLPRESASQLISAMVHPLNRPRFSDLKQRVIEGYGILQPRLAEALPHPGITSYLRLCGNEFGIDPYTRTVSDVYQDLFQEGSFIGKGIYDVDLFQQLLSGRFPENRILSHEEY